MKIAKRVQVFSILPMASLMVSFFGVAVFPFEYRYAKYGVIALRQQTSEQQGTDQSVEEGTDGIEVFGEGDQLFQRGLFQFNNGDPENAIPLWQQALEQYQQTHQQSSFPNQSLQRMAITLGNLGVAYRNLGEFDAAIERYEQQLEITREIGDRFGEATALGNLGVAYRNLGDYDAAIQLYDQQLSLLQVLEDLASGPESAEKRQQYRTRKSQVLGNLGNLYSLLGQYQRAIDHYEEELAIVRELGDRLGIGLSLGSLGTVYRNLGQYDAALDLYQQQLEIFQALKHSSNDRGRQRAGEIAVLGNMGIVHRALGQYDRAIALYWQQLEVSREGREALTVQQTGEATALGNLSIGYRELGQSHTAIELGEQALTIAEAVGDRRLQALVLGNLGISHRHLADYPTAMTHLQASLALFEEMGAPAEVAKTFHEIGTLVTAKGQPEVAIAFYKKAVNIRERIRGDLQTLSVDDQQTFTNTIAEDYRTLADVLLQQNRVLEAQRVIDLLRVQELDEYLRGIDSTQQTETGIAMRSSETDVLAFYQANQDRLIALGEEQNMLKEIPVTERTPVQQTRLIELRQLESVVRQQFFQFLESDKIKPFVMQLQQTTPGAGVDLTHLSELRDNLRQMDTAAVVLYPLVLEDRLELIVVTANQEPIRRTAWVSRTELNRAIADFRSTLSSPTSDPLPPAQELYQWLIQPIEADLEQANTDTLIYTPDAQLRYVPLAALHDGQQWIAERFQINNITAASLSDLDNKPFDDGLRVLAAAFTEGQYDVALSNRTLSFSGLAFAGPEIETLAERIPQTVKRLNQAFNRNILYEMNDYTIVHLATHAAFNPGPLENSFILFGDGSQVTLAEVKENWVFPNVELMVLSACETALGDIALGNGEEILGFGYLMQQAGADATMASLWQISDRGTQHFMDVFYTALSQGLSKAEALQWTQKTLLTGEPFGLDTQIAKEDLDQRELRIESIDIEQPSNTSSDTFTRQRPQARFSHPYYWASFLLIGNGL